MTVTLSPIQQADEINIALLGKFQASVWRQFGAVDPDLNYIFWSPTNATTPVVRHQHGPEHRPRRWRPPCSKGRRSADPGRPGGRLPAGQQAHGLGHPLHLERPDHLGHRSPAQGAEFQQSDHARGGKAFGFIGGAIWPTQIWLNS